MFSNRLLLWGIAFELVFAAMVIYVPPLQAIFGTNDLGLRELLPLLAFPFIVWGVRRAPALVGPPARGGHVRPCCASGSLSWAVATPWTSAVNRASRSESTPTTCQEPRSRQGRAGRDR